MKALASGRLGEALEAQASERIAQIQCGLDHLLEAEAFAGIEIEDHPVGLVGLVRAHAPGVDLENAHLHQGHQTGDILQIDVLARCLEAGDGDPRKSGGHARACVALVEAGLLPAGRAAHEGDRAICDVREHAVGDRHIIEGQIALGDALLGVKHLVGTGQADSADFDGFAFRLGRGRYRGAGGFPGRLPGWPLRRLGGRFVRLPCGRRRGSRWGHSQSSESSAIRRAGRASLFNCSNVHCPDALSGRQRIRRVP